MKITFDVKNQIITRTDRNQVISNSGDYLEAEISFSADWTGLEKTMTFKNGDELYTIVLANDKILQENHLNLGVGTWKASIIGIAGDQKIVTNECNVSVNSSGWIGSESIPPESVWNQLLVIIQSLHTEAASTAVVRSAVQKYIEDNYDSLVKEYIIIGNVREIIEELVQDGTISDLIAPFVTQELPGVVTTQLPGVVTSQLPAVVTSQLPSVVSSQLPAVAASAAAAEVGTWLTAHVDPDTGYVIDNTLTVSLAAADAKTVGDKVTEIKSALNDLLTQCNSVKFWERKTIGGAGEISDSTTRIKTVYSLDKEIKLLDIINGYKFDIVLYNGSTFIGHWNGSNYASYQNWFTSSVNIAKLQKTYSVFVLLAKTDDSDIQISDGSKLLCYSDVDSTLKKHGVPADAKTTGEGLSLLKYNESNEQENFIVTNHSVSESVVFTQNANRGLLQIKLYVGNVVKIYGDYIIRVYKANSVISSLSIVYDYLGSEYEIEEEGYYFITFRHIDGNESVSTQDIIDNLQIDGLDKYFVKKVYNAFDITNHSFNYSTNKALQNDKRAVFVAHFIANTVLSINLSTVYTFRVTKMTSSGNDNTGYSTTFDQKPICISADGVYVITFSTNNDSLIDLDDLYNHISINGVRSSMFVDKKRDDIIFENLYPNRSTGELEKNGQYLLSSVFQWKKESSNNPIADLYVSECSKDFKIQLILCGNDGEIFFGGQPIESSWTSKNADDTQSLYLRDLGYYRLLVSTDGNNTSQIIKVNDLDGCIETNVKELDRALNTKNWLAITEQSFPSGEAWTWWSYPQVIFDSDSNKLFYGYTDQNGYAGIVQHDVTTGSHYTQRLKKSKIDDHNAPSVNILPDGRPIVIYAGGHEIDYFMHMRVANDIKDICNGWSTDILMPSRNGRTTYSQMLFVNDKYYLFYRDGAGHWTCRVADNILSLPNANPLPFIASASDYVRYYIKVVKVTDSNYIRFCLYSNPSENDNDIRMGYIDTDTGNIYDSDGETLLGELGTELQSSDFSIVIPTETDKVQRLFDVAETDMSTVIIAYAPFTLSSMNDAIYKVYKNGMSSTICDAGENFKQIYQGGVSFIPNEHGSKVVVCRSDIYSNGNDYVEMYNFDNNSWSKIKTIYQETKNKIVFAITPNNSVTIPMRNCRPIVDAAGKYIIWQQGYYYPYSFTCNFMRAKIYSIERDTIIW